MIQIGVDVLHLIGRTASRRDVNAVDELSRLLAEDRLPLTDVGLVVAVDLDVGSVVERVEAPIVAVALALVAADPDAFKHLQVFKINFMLK